MCFGDREPAEVLQLLRLRVPVSFLRARLEDLKGLDYRPATAWHWPRIATFLLSTNAVDPHLASEKSHALERIELYGVEVYKGHLALALHKIRTGNCHYT